MRNKFSITITDVTGSKHFELSHVIKKFVIYFFALVVLLIGGGAYLINFLMGEVGTLEAKKEQIAREQLSLLEEQRILHDEISLKTQKYEDIRDKVENIEELIGIKASDDIDINERLDLLKVSSNDRKVIVENLPSGYPTSARKVTSRFGYRIHPITKRKTFHHGLDFGGKIGTPVKATSDGIVEFAGFHKGGYGYLIKLSHNFGFKTAYAHMTSKLKVKTGDYIKRGQVIGYLGNSGRSTGPHLHYEVKFIKRNLDPANFVKWNTINFEQIFKKETRVSWQSLVDAIIHQYHRYNQNSQLSHMQGKQQKQQKEQISQQKRLSLLTEQK